MANTNKQAVSVKQLVFQNFLPCRIKAINERSVRLLADTHERIDITAPEFGVLVVLAEQRGVSSREINKLTGMDKATITRALDRLITKELISRTRSGQDSRLIKLKLTAKGKRAFTRIEENALAWEQELVSGIRPAEMKTFYAVLERLDRNLDSLDGT